MKYGLPYKGSKNKLAERIVRLLPKRTHLVDLFCGGCAVSHAALLMGKFEHIHINDINWMCPTLFIDALNGKYNNEKRWISREDFFRLKDTDPYVAVVWSFGNNLRSYLYSKEIEPLKKAIHYAMFFSDYSLGKELGHDLSFIDPIQDLQKRYLAVKHYFNKLGHFQQQSLGGAESADATGNLQSHNPTCLNTNRGAESANAVYRGLGTTQYQFTELGQEAENLPRLETMEGLTSVRQSYNTWNVSTGCRNSKKKNRSGELCNCERRNTVASLAIPRAAAQSAQIFGGAVSAYHVLCA